MTEDLLMLTMPIWWPLLAILCAVATVAVIEHRDHRKRKARRTTS